MQLVPAELDSLIPESHQARTVWSFVEALDLSGWYAQIRVVEGGVGRTAIDPKILLALWLYATLDGVGSARELARLCDEHIAYRWICGGVSVNYHTLSDFRSDAQAQLDDLLTQSVAALRAAGAVTIARVAIDGTRIRASAGSGSFRRLATLERFRKEAAQQVAALRQELDSHAGGCSRQRRAGRWRAARERAARVAEALRQYPAAKAQKKHDKAETRVSITDPDARVMRMPDSGFRPAYNVQFVTDTQSKVLVDARVLNSGSDHGQLKSRVADLQARCGVTPQVVLADAGYAKPEDIGALAQGSPPCTVYAPVPELKTVKGIPIPPPVDESVEVKAWRERMKTEAGKEVYKERAATAELSNAQAHNRGLEQFLVRGLNKVCGVVLLFALANNLAAGVRLLRGGWDGLTYEATAPAAMAGEQPLPPPPAMPDGIITLPVQNRGESVVVMAPKAPPGDSS
jgi:transposase